MATVWIPPLLRDLAAGKDQAIAAGANVAEIIDALEQQFPGIRSRLCPDGAFRPGIAVIIDGQAARFGLLEPVKSDSEIHFVPAIAGGQTSGLTR